MARLTNLRYFVRASDVPGEVIVHNELDVYLACGGLDTYKTPEIRDWLARRSASAPASP